MRFVAKLGASLAGVSCGVLLLGCPSEETPKAGPAKEEPSPEREARRDLCKKSIDHVTMGIYPEESRPKDAEAAIIETLAKAATEVCVDEGFTQKQADCMMTAKIGDGLLSVRECLGDKKDWPSWFTGAGVQLP